MISVEKFNDSFLAPEKVKAKHNGVQDRLPQSRREEGSRCGSGMSDDMTRSS